MESDFIDTQLEQAKMYFIPFDLLSSSLSVTFSKDTHFHTLILLHVILPWGHGGDYTG